jgi:tripartite-type tricarboxylate transporter receptor subunit TctC
MRNRFISKVSPAIAAAACLALMGGAASASVQDFYASRNVDFLIGTAPGGGYDGYGRIVARHIGKHIPGNPSLIVRNMPGASGLVMTNHLYNVVARDGATLAILHNNMTVEPVIGNENARFDATRFNWIGSANKLANVCVAWHEVPVRTAEDLRSREWVVGGTARRSSTVQQANVFSVLGGANLKVIAGYPSSTSLILALERRELDIACGIGWDSIKSSTGYLQEGKIVPVMQLAYRESHPELTDVPFIYDMLVDRSLEPVLDFLTVRLFVGRAVATTPDVPTERVQALRDAMWNAMHDPEFVAEADRLLMEIQPTRGEDIQREVDRLAQTSREIVDVAARVLENDQNVVEANLNWREAASVTLAEVNRNGRSIVFSDGGRNVTATTQGGKVTIKGNDARAADLAVGMVCTISYLGDGDQARSVACQ